MNRNDRLFRPRFRVKISSRSVIVHRGNERCHTVNLIDLFVLNPRTRISDKRDFFFNSGERIVTEVTPLPERAFSSFQVFLPTE